MRLNHPLSRQSRARGAVVVVALLMGTLAVGFFGAQVLTSEQWALTADNNRLRQLGVPAPRGTIYDRYGEIIADNVPGYSVVLLPDQPDSIRSRLEGLQPYLNLSEGQIERLMREVRTYPGQTLTVKVNAPFTEVAALVERQGEFPGLNLTPRPRRRYPAGESMSHVLGYLGEITPVELEDSLFANDSLQRYEPGAIVGKDGLERQYENVLQGQPGFRYVEVDVLGES